MAGGGRVCVRTPIAKEYLRVVCDLPISRNSIGSHGIPIQPVHSNREAETSTAKVFSAYIQSINFYMWYVRRIRYRHANNQLGEPKNFLGF